MTQLSCSVTNCIANENHLCSYESIHVDSNCGGTSTAVHTKDDTCCKSFAERSAAPVNSIPTGAARSSTEIRCNVTDCQYNEQEKCSASSIVVQGDGASADQGTRCGTYKTR